jgi:uncharacterized protein (UPF0303 family)
MSPDLSDRIRILEDQERELVLDRFDQDDAWNLGRLIVEAAREAGQGVLVDIRKPNFTLFRAALPGTAPDQEVWAGRKAALVLRMESSSALFAARMKSAGIDPTSIGWLDSGYALAGGSFPIRVSGVGVVAAVTASGLSSDDDHDLVITGLRALLASN